MQDRFRFRAWNSDESKYATDDDICFDTGGECECVYDLLKVNDSFYTIEQCTGLKDKNGKLIYEGDIVGCNFSGKANTAETFAKKVFQGKHIVEFLEYYFSPFNYVNASDVEVIGNIHENSELLEGNK